MTRPLASRVKQVVAVETDPILADLLRRDAPDNLEVIEADILKFDLNVLPPGYKVIANLPYYLTSKIFRLLIESHNPPSVMSVLIQKEVAQRICAKPGAMSILALSVQYWGQPEMVAQVENYKFWPAPEVDSTVLKVTLTGPAFSAEPDRLFRLIKAGYGEKRKQLKNALSGGLNCTVDKAADLISKAKLAPTVRAQELSLTDWQRLYTLTTREDLV